MGLYDRRNFLNGSEFGEQQRTGTVRRMIDEIARLYRIPPHMVGDLDKSSFSNIEQQSLEFVKCSAWRSGRNGRILVDRAAFF